MLAPARARPPGLPHFWGSQTGSRCTAGTSPVVWVDVLGVLSPVFWMDVLGVLEGQARRRVWCVQGQGWGCPGREGWSSDAHGSLVQKGTRFSQK